MTTERKPRLLPQPRHVEFTGAHFTLTGCRCILLDSPQPSELLFTAKRVQKILQERFGLVWELVASKATPSDQIALTLHTGSSYTPPDG